MKISSFLAVLGLFILAPRLAAEPASFSVPAQPLTDPPTEAATIRVILKMREQGHGSRFMLALSLARLGALEEALKTVAATPETDPTGVDLTRQDIIRLVVRRRAFLGQISGAEALLPRLTHVGARLDALLALGRAELRAKNREKARGWALQARELLETEQKKAQDGPKRLDFGRFSADTARQAIQTLLDKSQKAVAPTDAEKDLAQARELLRWAGAAGFADVAMTLAGEGQGKLVLKILAPSEATDSGLKLLYLAGLFLKTGDDALARQALEIGAEKFALAQQQAAKNSKIFAHIFPELAAAEFARAFEQVGDEASAQKWLENAQRGQTEARQAAMAIGVKTAPLARPANLRKVTPEKRAAMAREVQSLLALKPPLDEVFDSLQWLFQAQIAAGETEAARQTVSSFQKLFDATPPRRANSFEEHNYPKILALARDWREVGDEAQAQKLVKQYSAQFKVGENFFDLFETAGLENFGFIDEAVALYSSLGPERMIGGSPPEWAYYVARRATDFRKSGEVPAWIAKSEDMYNDAYPMAGWVRALTSSIFQTQEEREFEFSATGKDAESQ